jgi:hypothetical protein
MLGEERKDILYPKSINKLKHSSQNIIFISQYKNSIQKSIIFFILRQKNNKNFLRPQQIKTKNNLNQKSIVNPTFSF